MKRYYFILFFLVIPFNALGMKSMQYKAYKTRLDKRLQDRSDCVEGDERQRIIKKRLFAKGIVSLFLNISANKYLDTFYQKDLTFENGDNCFIALAKNFCEKKDCLCCLDRLLLVKRVVGNKIFAKEEGLIRKVLESPNKEGDTFFSLVSQKEKISVIGYLLGTGKISPYKLSEAERILIQQKDLMDAITSRDLCEKLLDEYEQEDIWKIKDNLLLTIIDNDDVSKDYVYVYALDSIIRFYMNTFSTINKKKLVKKVEDMIEKIYGEADLEGSDSGEVESQKKDAKYAIDGPLENYIYKDLLDICNRLIVSIRSCSNNKGIRRAFAYIDVVVFAQL